jgi:16S rRNA (uracil1498-N3)-methyltransferase
MTYTAAVSQSSWFFASRDDWRASHVVLDEDETHHALRVLRLAPGAPMIVSDGAGTVAQCSIGEVVDGRLIAEIEDKRRHTRPRPELMIYQAASKGHKIDEITDACGQLGVTSLCVFETSRTLVRWNQDKRQRLADRWEAIARSAAKQSRDPFVVETGPPTSWSEMLDNIARQSFAVMLWERSTTPLREVLPAAADRIALIVGPEGGFSADEAADLDTAGARQASLGPLILRTEMAPVVACSVVLWQYGLIG